MGDVVRNKYTVTVDLDPEVWDANYGPDKPVTDDMRDCMWSVISDLVNEWIRTTGNTGRAEVKPL